jgi:hypothetical protein
VDELEVVLVDLVLVGDRLLSHKGTALLVTHVQGSQLLQGDVAQRDELVTVQVTRPHTV